MEQGLIAPAIMVTLAVIGGVGGYFTYKAKIDFLAGLVKDLRSDHEAEVKRGAALEEKNFALELRVEREFVKKNDLAAVEDRLSRRIDGVVHDLKGATAQIIAALQVRPRAQSGVQK